MKCSTLHSLSGCQQFFVGLGSKKQAVTLWLLLPTAFGTAALYLTYRQRLAKLRSKNLLPRSTSSFSIISRRSPVQAVKTRRKVGNRFRLGYSLFCERVNR